MDYKTDDFSRPDARTKDRSIYDEDGGSDSIAIRWCVLHPPRIHHHKHR